MDLRKKITYSEDPEQQGEKGFGSTIVRVYLKKGKVWEYRAYPNPEERVEGWTEEQLKEKFNECCNVSGNPKEAERLWNICQSLEESDDITTWLEQWPERIKNEND